MRAKYIEQRFHPYEVYEIRSRDGRVSLGKGEGEYVLATVESMAQAKRLIQDREATVDMLAKLASALIMSDPLAFNQIWQASMDAGEPGYTTDEEEV